MYVEKKNYKKKNFLSNYILTKSISNQSYFLHKLFLTFEIVFIIFFYDFIMIFILTQNLLEARIELATLCV